MQIGSFGPVTDSLFPPEAAAVTEVVFQENFDSGLSGWNQTVCQASPPEQQCIMGTVPTIGVSPPSLPNWGRAGIIDGPPNCLPGSIKATFEKKFSVANEGDYTLSATISGSGCDICDAFAQLFLDGVEKFKREGRNTSVDGSGPPIIFSEQASVHLTAGMHTIGIGGGVVPPNFFPFICSGFFGGFFDDIIVQREIPDQFDVEKFYTETDVNFDPICIAFDPGPDELLGTDDDVCIEFRPQTMDEASFGTPLLTDPPTGKFLLEAVVKKDGTLSSYNPGQYYAVTKVTVKEDLSNLWIEELFGDCTDRPNGINLSIVNPNKVPGGAAVVIVDPLGAVMDRSDELEASGALFLTDDDNDLITDNAELHLQESIPKDSMVYLYVKFAPGLKGQPLPSEPDNMCNNEEIVSTMIDAITIEESAEADLIVKAK